MLMPLVRALLSIPLSSIFHNLFSTMNIRRLNPILAFSLWLGFTSLMAGPRDAQWAEVKQAMSQQLPRTALQALDPLIAAALAERAYPEAIRAIVTKIGLESAIEGGDKAAQERIRRLQSEIAEAPVEMRPAMSALLAHGFWQFFQQNRWRFQQRSATSVDESDFLTWDLSRILDEIDRQFMAAIANETVLMSTPIVVYDDLLVKGDVPDAYRPTLYDFLVQEALSFYQSGEQGAKIAEGDFIVDTASPIFAPVSDFIAWKPVSPDTGYIPALRTITLYQRLLAFHASDTDRSAFYDADLSRLAYGKNIAVGEDKDARFRTALERFIEETAHHEISSRALAVLAQQWNTEGDPVKAHALAQRGRQAFPDSPGAKQCANLINQIEARSTRVTTEYVWTAPWPTLDVTYRNISRVHFRAVSGDFAAHVKRARGSYGWMDDSHRRELLATSPALAWDANLKPTPDFKERTEQLPVPKTLKPGFYYLLASFDPSFSTRDNQLSVTPFWVSSLALVIEGFNPNGRPRGWVLDSESGSPIAGATLRFWKNNQRGAYYEPAGRATTDAAGGFTTPAGEGQLIALAEHAGQAVASADSVFFSNPRRPNDSAETSHTLFFTDRSLYRPGQSIHYKGIALALNRNGKDHRLRSGETVTVIFRDPNGKEISQATHRTNDYGSFQGVFTAPSGRLTGAMTISTDDRTGSTGVRVEEYKRPKFQVELTAPTEAAKLAATVVVPGKATSYSGIGIGGAKVKWRVERRVQMPPWCWWWQPPQSKAIAHGTAVPAADGAFSLEFTASPDAAVPEKNEPVFLFHVFADVTDSTGETRTASRVVRAGYTALQVAAAVDAWQTPENPVRVQITTQSLDGDPQPAEGTVAVYALKQPQRVQRASLSGGNFGWPQPLKNNEPAVDPGRPETWELGANVAEQPFSSNADGVATVAVALPAGIYRAQVETRDRFGKVATARALVTVADPSAARFPIRLPNHFAAEAWTLQPGQTFTALWATGYDTGRALVEIECAGKLLKSYWTTGAGNQEAIHVPVTEDMRGGITVSVMSVRENRAYLNQRVVDVPWKNKELTVTWESFRSKLAPGQKETWTAVVKGPDAEFAVAEVAATMYDASLDQFSPHNWPLALATFRRESPRGVPRFTNGSRLLIPFAEWDDPLQYVVNESYRRFHEDVAGLFGSGDRIELSPFSVASAASNYGYRSVSLAGARGAALEMPMAAAPGAMVLQDEGASQDKSAVPTPTLDQVQARQNLNETAFFFPQLVSSRDGEVRLEFTMPEALTEWKVLGFAHDRLLRSGRFTGKAVTAKDLMVEPNPPRFVREGDALEFTVKVSNQTAQAQRGTVRLTFADAVTQKAVDDALGNRATEQSFEIPAHQSRTHAWRIAVPDGAGALAFKAVAATSTLSDGEEALLPVLSRRILVTESLPLPIRGKTEKTFDFAKLSASAASPTLRHQSLTVQMTSQPAWYAVLALPYLMEFPHECSEQVFNRYYANALAGHIAHSDPKIRRVFDLWKATPALDSPLRKNQDLKSLLIEETPWLREADDESAARRNVGLLFDRNRLQDELAGSLHQLTQQQGADGLWPWFPGGRGSEYISLYVAAGFGRLRHLGVPVETGPAVKSLAALDAWIAERIRHVQSQPKPEEFAPSYLDAFYLYGRSFFLKDHPIASQHREAIDFLIAQARKGWTRLDSRQSQGHLALGLLRFGDASTARAIAASLSERSVRSEEMGMHWRDSDASWWWYRAPIETQAMMIEVFSDVTGDKQAVEDCQVWLLKQKQTQNWRTTKATADAVYALLMRGTQLLSSDARVQVSLGGETLKPEKTEAGTGFYEKRFAGSEVRPTMGRIVVKKTDDGVSWGGVHWQYLEDIGKVTAHTGTPLTLKKTLFVRETTSRGQVLKPITGALAVGDELVVRLELRVDRDMEYLHLKDRRGSGTEPVNVLSRYKYQDGLGYYESTRDTATHFFIERLPRGTYVFEYPLRIQLKGEYQSGLAEIQCMYAPEFNSHSESVLLKVQ